MPSDVNDRISQLIKLYNQLQTVPPSQDDARQLYGCAAELEGIFQTAQKAADELRKIFEGIKDQVKDKMFEGAKEGTLTKDGRTTPTLAEGKLRSNLNDPLAKIKEKLKAKEDKNQPSDLDQQLTNLAPLGVSTSGGIAALVSTASPTDASPKTSSSSQGDSKDEGAIQMQKFFTDVTQSLIGAQAELNHQSLDYAARLDPRIPPVYYSIPSLKAEMKLGFSKEEGKGMNLILFKSEAQRKNYGESTLSFELVAVPPPPGTAPPELPPDFLLVGDEKQALLDKVRTAAGDSLRAKLTENFDRTQSLAAVLRYPADEGKTKYLIFWPSQTEKDQQDKPDFWRKMLVLHLVEEKGQLQADPSVFDPKFPEALDSGKQYLLISDTAGLNNLKPKPEALVATINCFGDAVLKALKIFAEYYQANV